MNTIRVIWQAAIILPIAAGLLGPLFVVGSTAPLAWRRSFPVEAALVSSAFWLIPVDGFPVLGLVAVTLQFLALGRWSDSNLAVLLTVTAASSFGVIGTLLGPEPPVASIGTVLVVVAPTLAGRALRHERRRNDALESLTRELAEERELVKQAAVGAERARIAGEMHDALGHEITLIAIQAEAASAALRVDPARSVPAVESIRSTAHRMLAEMRSILDVVDPDGDIHRDADDLTGLAERARAAGISNELSVAGSPPPRQAPVSLAVYRIARECLTNAGRHAPGEPVSIDVDWRPDAVHLRSTNHYSGLPPVEGRGLTGVRHRAELLGGSFELCTADSTFAVVTCIPMVRS